MKINNPFIYINLSPWPINMTINTINMTNWLIFSIIFNFNYSLIFINIMIISNLIMWNFNSNINKIIFNYKNMMTNISMKSSMMLFIISEMMFFSSFFYVFWSNKFFIIMLNKFYLTMFKLNFIMALMNLMILLSSSISFMIFIKMNIMNILNKFLMWTIMLSFYFIYIQLIEYKFLHMTINNSIFFSLFFMLTLFHMTHVIMGTMMMINILFNKMVLMNNFMIKMINICWYWHFIDFIWILIFFIIY